MSMVTDTILTFSVMEEERQAIRAVNEVLSQRHQEFVLTSAHEPQMVVCGGGKNLQCHIALAAFNHVPDKLLIWALRSYEWSEPESVRMFVSRENDEFGFSELEWAKK